MPDYNPFCDSTAATAKLCDPLTAGQTARIAQEQTTAPQVANLRGGSRGGEKSRYQTVGDLKHRQQTLLVQRDEIDLKLDLIKGVLALFE